MSAYYNEIDPYAAAWLRTLIAAELIAPGDVDTRSIEDVTPDDLAGYTQCHFFAGIGGWGYALRLAGWGDDRPVWTGSCPCQPFSAAGKNSGFDDERHLWPAWHYLIEQRRPRIIFGEQVASPAGLGWLDLVQADLEAAGYACAPVDLCAAGVGAPHIRQRLYFVAESSAERRERERLHLRERGPFAALSQARRSGEVGSMADDARSGRREKCADVGGQPAGDKAQGGSARLESSSGFGLVGNADDEGSQRRSERRDGASECAPGSASVAGFWTYADWLPCRDGKWRPVEPGTFPLAHGIPSRVGRLRAYGNAIVAPLAAEMIRAYVEACNA